MSAKELETAPFKASDLARLRAALAEKLDAASAFERMASALDDAQRADFTRMAKESRAAWTLFLASAPGDTLLVGPALTGAAVPLAMRSRRLVLCDVSRARLELARAWILAAAPHVQLSTVIADADARLPFVDRSFDLVVQESAPATPKRAEELARVARDELAFAFDGNADIVPAGFERARSFGLHPAREDPAQLMACDGAGPRLFAGPSRRRALMLNFARASGLLARRVGARVRIATRKAQEPAIERALATIAERIGEPVPRIEHVLGSCGNTCELFTTAPRGAHAGWRLHLPMRPDHVPGIACNHEQLEHLRAHHPGLPLPEPLFAGEAGGLWLTCERRLPGFAGDLVVRDLSLADRVAAQAAKHLAQLVSRPAAIFTEHDFEGELGPAFEHALTITSDARARAALEDLRERARSQLVGLALPRVALHGDLRAKHVQVERDGKVVGYVHWGVAIPAGLPYFDLLHLFVHARVQCGRQTIGAAWRALAAGDDLRAGERHALQRYTEALDLEREAARALALAYPAFIATVAFSYAALAPPDWLARQFELGG